MNNGIRTSWIEMMTPEQKDMDRARKLILEDAAIGRARSMAKAIKSDTKMIRRAKAMCKVWYDHNKETSISGEQFLNGIWNPFEARLKDFDFSDEEIRLIKQYGFDRGKRLDLI